MEETPSVKLFPRQLIKRKRVKFSRMYEPHLNQLSNSNETHELVDDVIFEDKASPTVISQNNSRPTIHWDFVVEGDSSGKEQINTDTDHFDALFARSNASPLPSPHPRCYSSCSPATAPQSSPSNTSAHFIAKSQPLLPSSPSFKPKQSCDSAIDASHKQSTSSTSTPKSQQSNPALARTKRKNFSLTHAAQTFLQASNTQNEQLEPLARSCSYKRPQSIKKYRQKKKEKEKDQHQYFSAHKSNTSAPSQNSQSFYRVTSDSFRKSIATPTGRVSVADLMANDDTSDQRSSPNTERAARIGSLTLDQLKLPPDGGEEIYLVRQFHTTSKGFVNRGDSFKRSFKRSDSTSRRSSCRINTNITPNDGTSSQEHDTNHSPSSTKDIHTSIPSLTHNSSGANLNGLLDTHFIDTNPSLSSIPLPDHGDNDDEEEEDDDNPLVERIQTEDGCVHDVHVYQVYLLGMSGTGKCSLIRQFKTTEYRGIYDNSSSVEDDPDNTVSIMLDGVESRLHIINMDIDHIKSSVVGDAYVVVYSITDRHSFQTALQFIKSIRDNELAHNQSPIKRHVPIILVGNKSDLVRKRAVTKEAARHAALKNECKFIETSAAINDKVDDLLAGTLKQIRINEQFRNEQKRRLTVANGSIDTNDSEAPILTKSACRKTSGMSSRSSKNVFIKLLNVFRKKPSRLPIDVENLNTGIG
ncbi:unnamed protein product [Rotaria magnacalcarata]|uniref:Uncharacterized protein n=2 Tax=Rotaria magnacalcarata TaxID=392030 RepID=A0A816GY72_9BILA|nr:unnamed protein product [Rotaria magnacalcarata]CAF1681479.1 unnamed protein product [Rotaria magnacalcarata]CAF3903629.1 unnamed protein product [Rotaria magnacalcarata]